ncbi:MAG: hypothetical protein K9J81_10490, partial [Desulfohalobiaceae bacterium]|nr:hypothetical protein [Desulfohalobiaceae bacterium]
MTLSTRILRIIKWPTIVCLSLFLLLTLVFFLLQTETARKKLTAYLEKAISREEMHIELSGFHGWLPIDFTLEEATFSDAQGPFLKIKKAHLAWSPLNLLTGTIQVQSIGAGAIDFQRLPQLPEGPERKDAEKKKDQGIFSLPPILVKGIYFPHIALGAELTGDPAVFSLSVHLDMTSLARLEGDLRLKRIDRPGLSSRLSAGYTEPNLDLDWRFQSPGGGLLETLLGRELPGPIDFHLQGRGPVKDWGAELNLVLEDRPVLAADLNLRPGETELNLKAEGALWPADYLPRPYRGLVDQTGPLPFALDLVYDRTDNLLSYTKIELSTDWASLDIRGSLDLGNESLDQRLDLTINELSGLKPLSPVPLKGSARLQARINGPWKLPEARLNLEAGLIEVDDYKAEETSLDLVLRPQVGPGAGFQSVELSGTSRSKGFSSTAFPLELSSAEVRFKAGYRLDSGLNLHQLKVKTPNEDLALNGWLRTNGRFQAEVTAALQDIQDLSLDVSLPLSGGLNMSGEASGNLRSREISARGRTRFLDLGGLPRDLLELTGKNPELEFRLGLDKQRMNLESAALAGDHLNLTLRGGIGLKRKDVDLDWDLTGPRLEQLAFCKDLACQGRVEASGGLQGSFTDLRATMKAEVAEFRLPALLPATLTVRAGAGGLPSSPQGELSLDLARSNRLFQFRTEVAYSDQFLQLKNIKAQAPQTKLTGSLSLDLPETSLQTSLDLQAEDVSWLQAFIPDPGIAGGLSLELTAAGPLDNPKTTLEFQANDLSYSGLRAAALSGKLHVLDIPGQKLDLHLSGRRIDTGGVLLKQTEVTVKGDRDAYDLALNLRGTAREDFRLQTLGRLSITDTLQRIVLKSGSGGFGSIPLSWSKPLAFERSGQDLRLSCPGLDLGQGELRVSTGLQQDRLQGRISLSGFDLSTLEAEALPPLLGQISLELDLAGTPKKPELDLATSIQGLQPVGDDLPEIHPIAADLTASYRQDDFQAALQAASLGVDVKTRLQVPTRLSLRPFVLKPGEGLKGSAHMTANLEVLGAMLDLEGQRVAGRLKSDLGFSGSLPVPDLKGRAVLEQGSYENVRSGTILRDLSLQCTFEDKTIHLQSLTASDGQEGTISLTGKLSLPPDNGFLADASLLLKKARLVRMDALDAQADGEIHFTKDVTASELSGELSI